MVEEIKYKLETVPRNRQSTFGRRYASRRLKSNGVDRVNGELLSRLKLGELCRVYKDKFGECKDFKNLRLRKMDSTAYLYYVSIKNKYSEDDSDGVYIIGNLKHAVCKIGYSKNPHKRIKSIQTGCPYPISILKYYSGIGKREEKLLHRKYQRYKLQGEWFEIKGAIKHELIN